MITLQMMKGTGPYNQMQRYIADVHKDLTPQQRAGKFTALLKKYLQECNTCFPHQDFVTRRVVESFGWMDSKDGWDFWEKVESYSTQPLEVKKEQPVVKPPVVAEQPKPAAPALVWPKGATHYRTDLKRFFNEKGQWYVDDPMMNPYGFYPFMGARTYEKWSALPRTIKRPETPLPNGLQWEEDYTHYNPIVGGFQFNLTHLQQPALGLKKEAWLENGRVQHWMSHENTIQRYPDNQPLILDVPPQAPVRPVGRRGDEPVPRVPEMENVVVKAPVEPPKVPPVAKKQVGWWK